MTTREDMRFIRGLAIASDNLDRARMNLSILSNAVFEKDYLELGKELRSLANKVNEIRDRVDDMYFKGVSNVVEE